MICIVYVSAKNVYFLNRIRDTRFEHRFFSSFWSEVKNGFVIGVFLWKMFYCGLFRNQTVLFFLGTGPFFSGTGPLKRSVRFQKKAFRFLKKNRLVPKKNGPVPKKAAMRHFSYKNTYNEVIYNLRIFNLNESLVSINKLQGKERRSES